ncbi:MAG: class II fructose-bisphosphate aldolase [Christensenellales bacterium]
MPLVTTRDMMQKALREGYAVGAFNIENMEIAQAVVSAAEKANAPVIIQTTTGTLQYAPPQVFHGMVAALAQAARVPVALHLDHGASLDLLVRCKQAGYTSLMIDGSKLPFEQNVALSAQAVQLAGDVPVEAELGQVGGREDGHEASLMMTDPQMAARFVRETGIFSLAVAIGTAHGVYKGVPHLDMPRLAAIHQAAPIPLVLHGTSGVPEDQVRECVKLGICKVNYATDLRQAYTAATRAWLQDNPDAFDPKLYGEKARLAVERVVMQRMELVGSCGKAQ